MVGASVFLIDAMFLRMSKSGQYSSVSCLRTVLDRACANLPEKLQITPVKGVGIVNAIRLSALFFNGMAKDNVHETKTATAIAEATRGPG
jgi:hypothetical protein